MSSRLVLPFAKGELEGGTRHLRLIAQRQVIQLTTHGKTDSLATTTPLRIVLAKIGLDGHDRGVKVVARGLRDAGFHVIYSGLWQSPAAVARTVADEDADWLGLSLLSGAHLTLVPRLLQELKEHGLDQVGVLVGGIVPEEDIPKLTEMGVDRVFGPGTAISEIVDFLRDQGSRTDA